MEKKSSSAPASTSAPASAGSGGRILSLDIFRGLTVALMIMVNNQAGTAFAALRHKSWDGCTPTDLVFPFFLFIVGVSLWFSYRKTGHRLDGGTALRLLKRGAAIFAVGLLLNWFPFWDFRAEAWKSFENLRIMGVLQRIGLAFFLGGVIALWLKSFRRIIVAAVVLLAGYWLGVELLGDATREGFVGNRVDGFLLGADHLYRPDESFDPEGIFSTIPAIATVLLGYMTGKFVGENRSGGAADAASRMKVLGTLGLAGGGLVVAGLAFNTVSPINKAIWSPTFVLYTAGLAMLVWSLLLWFYDYRGRRLGATFGATFGTNALFAYVLAWVIMTLQYQPFALFEVDGTMYSVHWWLSSRLAAFTTPQIGTLLGSLVVIGVIWLLVYPLYRRRIFIRL
jgi:predicted acyltransferase